MKTKLLFRPAALAAGLSLLLLSPACTYEEAPPCVLESSDVRYQADIVPILVNNCLECHGEKVYLSLGGGYNYDPSTPAGFTQFQNKALDGTLVKVVEQKDNNYRAVFMPRNNPKLSACDIERIKLWVKNKAPKD